MCCMKYTTPNARNAVKMSMPNRAMMCSPQVPNSRKATLTLSYGAGWPLTSVRARKPLGVLTYAHCYHPRRPSTEGAQTWTWD